MSSIGSFNILGFDKKLYETNPFTENTLVP